MVIGVAALLWVWAIVDVMAVGTSTCSPVRKLRGSRRSCCCLGPAQRGAGLLVGRWATASETDLGTATMTSMVARRCPARICAAGAIAV